MPAQGYSNDFKSDTPLNDFQYCGWIPCLSGHLDFALMRVGMAGDKFGEGGPSIKERCTRWFRKKYRKTDHVTDSFNFAYADHPQRHYRRIALQSWYDWRDTRTGMDGRFRVIVVAESNRSVDPDNRTLQGYVCIFPRAYAYEEDVSPARRIGSNSIMQIFDTMRETEKQYPDIDPLLPDLRRLEKYQQRQNESWRQLYDRMLSEAPLDIHSDLSEVYLVQFRVESNGIIGLSYIQEQNSPRRPNEHGFIVARQAYYYLKYSLHKHKHHNDDSDTLTTIIPYRSDEKALIGQTLLLQLKRDLVFLKRSGITTGSHHSRSTDALGVLAYAKSLAQACANSNLMTHEITRREMTNLEAIADSLSVNNAVFAQDTLQKANAAQTARQWATIGLAYISISCLILLNLFPQDTEGDSFALTTWVAEQSATAIILYFLVGGFLLWLTIKGLTELERIKYHEGFSYFLARQLRRRWVAAGSLTLTLFWTVAILYVKA